MRFCNLSFDLPDLGDGQDQERSSSAGFDDDRQELWVDGTEGAVPRYLGDADVIVGLLGLHRLAEDVAKLALPHNAATHGCGKEGRVIVAFVEQPCAAFINSCVSMFIFRNVVARLIRRSTVAPGDRPGRSRSGETQDLITGGGHQGRY